jgi:hypothetical protein
VNGLKGRVFKTQNVPILVSRKAAKSNKNKMDIGLIQDLKLFFAPLRLCAQLLCLVPACPGWVASTPLDGAYIKEIHRGMWEGRISAPRG